MKKLVLVMALIFLVLTYGNYRKQQVISRTMNYQPKPKRVRSLSYEELAARNKVAEKKLTSPVLHDSTTIIDTAFINSINCDSVNCDSLVLETINNIPVFFDITDSLRNDLNEIKQ